jgi:hypothetical protein
MRPTAGFAGIPAGSALAIQTALGFLPTGVTILTVGLLGLTDAIGWRVAFGMLALGRWSGSWPWPAFADDPRRA